MFEEVKASQVLPGVRLAGDNQLNRSFAGWVGVVFHRAIYYPDKIQYILIYTVKMSESDKDIKIVKIRVRKGFMLDRSMRWVSGGVVRE